MDIVQHESGLYNRHSTIQRSTKQCNSISNTIQIRHNVFFLGNNFRIVVITCAPKLHDVKNFCLFFIHSLEKLCGIMCLQLTICL